LTKLEGALRPREAVLTWLVDAQLFPSLVDHARSIAELPVEAAPISVIGRRVEAAVRAEMKGQPRDAIETAVRRAIGDAVFLFTLVFQQELASGWASWRSVVDRLGDDLRVESEARATLERQFFGGHDVLFADVAKEWAGHVDMVGRLTTLAGLMSWTGKEARRPPTGMPVGASVKARVADRVASLADDARVRAYEALGDRSRAVEMMERRLSVDWVPQAGEASI